VKKAAPKPKGPPRLLTKAGFARMAAEHDELLLVERPKVVQGVATAAAEGDRSENAEYIYGKKRLREIDKRLRYLGMLLRDVKIVDPDTLRGDAVCFGSTVTVVDEDGVEKRYTIVGEGEAEWRNHEISYKSPVARALIGKRIGEVITARRPAGEIELEITDLHYNGRSYEEPPRVLLPGSVKMPSLTALPADFGEGDEDGDEAEYGLDDGDDGETDDEAHED
jgi:transcription elongation factor GreB